MLRIDFTDSDVDSVFASEVNHECKFQMLDLPEDSASISCRPLPSLRAPVFHLRDEENSWLRCEVHRLEADRLKLGKEIRAVITALQDELKSDPSFNTIQSSINIFEVMEAHRIDRAQHLNEIAVLNEKVNQERESFKLLENEYKVAVEAYSQERHNLVQQIKELKLCLSTATDSIMEIECSMQVLNFELLGEVVDFRLK